MSSEAHPAAPNHSTAMALAIVDELARNSVRDLVLAPGSRSAAVALAAAAHPELSVWVQVDERSAGFFALGMCRAGKAAAVLTTSGTAAANLYPAVVEADQAHIPLLALTADRPPELRASGANQTIDQVKMFSDRVRWFADLPIPEDRPGESGFWRSTVCRAVAETNGRTGSAGPVHLNLCFREPLVPATHDGRVAGTVYRNSIEGRADRTPWTRTAAPRPVPARLSDATGRVLVVAGAGADRRLVEEGLQAGCVVVAEGHSGCRLAGTITTAHHLLSSSLFQELAKPDLVIVTGRAGLSRNLDKLLDGVEVTTVGPGWFDPERRATIHLEAAEWGRLDPDRSWLSWWLRMEDVARQVLDAEMDAGDTANEPRAARDTAASVPRGGLLAVASSMPIRDLDWFASAGPTLEVICNRGASGIDGLVSLALGAAAAGRGPVVALAGDLSLLHDQNGFLVRPRPELVMVVINNDGGGIFSFLPQAGFPEAFERLFGTPTGIDLASLAAAHRLGHRRIERGSDLGPAIRSSLDAGGCHLIEVATDRAENVLVHRRLTARVVKEIEASLQG